MSGKGQVRIDIEPPVKLEKKMGLKGRNGTFHSKFRHPGYTEEFKKYSTFETSDLAELTIVEQLLGKLT